MMSKLKPACNGTARQYFRSIQVPFIQVPEVVILDFVQFLIHRHVYVILRHICTYNSYTHNIITILANTQYRLASSPCTHTSQPPNTSTLTSPPPPIYTAFNKSGKAGKAVPLQAQSGPEGSRKLRFPDYVTMSL